MTAPPIPHSGTSGPVCTSTTEHRPRIHDALSLPPQPAWGTVQPIWSFVQAAPVYLHQLHGTPPSVTNEDVVLLSDCATEIPTPITHLSGCCTLGRFRGSTPNYHRAKGHGSTDLDYLTDIIHHSSFIILHPSLSNTIQAARYFVSCGWHSLGNEHFAWRFAVVKHDFWGGKSSSSSSWLQVSGDMDWWTMNDVCLTRNSTSTCVIGLGVCLCLGGFDIWYDCSHNPNGTKYHPTNIMWHTAITNLNG